MNTYRYSLVVVLIATVAGVAGYWFGFRDGFDLGPKVNAAPKGVLALSTLRLIQRGDTVQPQSILQSDIDIGLLWWHDVRQFPLSPYLASIWGFDVYPQNEKYVRILAKYRVNHPSPFMDEKLTLRMLENMPPDLRPEMEESGKEINRTLKQMIQEYGHQTPGSN
jgi:hypothetical protein